ncbi:MAG: hypothetical protein ACUVUH_03610 [bacterium]
MKKVQRTSLLGDDKISHAEAISAFQRALIRIKVGQRKRKK